MKCQYCDSELVPGAKFCDSCGSPVGDASQQPPAVPYTNDYLKEQPAAPQPPVVPYPPAGSVEPQPPAQDPFQVPYSNYQSSGTVPPPAYNTSPSAPDEKIMGLPAAQMGNIALGLGGVGCLLSFLGCGGLISLLGVIAGFLALKTSGRRNGTIGLVLSIVGLIIALVMVCILLFSFINSQGSSYNY
jgi:hypothetical protein